MGTVNLSDYRGLYLETAREYINSLSKSCIELADNPSDKNSLNQLHISSHSLRSQSQVMSYANISAISQAIEKIAREILEGKYAISEKIISVLNKAITELNLLLADLENDGGERDIGSLVQELEEVSEG